MVPLEGRMLRSSKSATKGGMVASAANAGVDLGGFDAADGPRRSKGHPRRRREAWEFPRWWR